MYASTAVTTGRSVGDEDHWMACAAKAVRGPGQTGQRGASRTPTQLQAQRSLGLSTEEAEGVLRRQRGQPEPGAT